MGTYLVLLQLPGPVNLDHPRVHSETFPKKGKERKKENNTIKMDGVENCLGVVALDRTDPCEGSQADTVKPVPFKVTDNLVGLSPLGR